MANYVGLKLSRLIKERAYLSGSLSSTQKEVDDLRSKLKTKENELAQKTDRIAEVDKLIAEQSAIDTADIRAIRSMPRKMNGEHGGLTRELIAALKIVDKPVASGVLVEYLAEMFGYPMDTPQQRAKTRKYIRGPLNLLRKRGVVVRHPSLDGSRQGRWQWIGYQDQNQP